MNLSDFCRRITGPDTRLLPENHKLGARLVCPEYSKSVQEVKTYPLLGQDRSFLLCWNFDSPGNLYATMMPSPENFCYHYSYSEGKYTQLHTHDYLELSYVVEGEFHQRILNKDVVFQKGDLCLIDKNCLHQEIMEGTSATLLFLGITNVMFQDIMKRQITTERISSFLKMALMEQKSLQQYLHFLPQAEEAVSQMDETMTSLLLELQRHDEASPIICRGLLLRIFRILNTQYEFSLSKKLRQKMNWILYEEISDYMKQNMKNISIRMLCEEFHFQEDYFNRLLKNRTRMTYTEYLQHLRLQKAEELLLHTRLTIDAIAAEVGYKNKGYFYKIFTERHRMTPAQFRKESC